MLLLESVGSGMCIDLDKRRVNYPDSLCHCVSTSLVGMNKFLLWEWDDDMWIGLIGRQVRMQ